MGLFFAFVACILIALSFIIQRSFLKGKKFSILAIIKSKKWWMGYGIGAVGGLFYILAMTRIEISILQPFMNLTPAFVALFAFFVFKEKLDKKEIIGIVILFVAAILLGVQI